MDRNRNSDASLMVINDYASFLSQPLKLGMFIPCDENDEPLEDIETIYNGTDEMILQYQQAKERGFV